MCWRPPQDFKFGQFTSFPRRCQINMSKCNKPTCGACRNFLFCSLKKQICAVLFLRYCWYCVNCLLLDAMRRKFLFISQWKQSVTWWSINVKSLKICLFWFHFCGYFLAFFFFFFFFQKKKDMPTAQQRRKHQISYLAFQVISTPPPPSLQGRAINRPL